MFVTAEENGQLFAQAVEWTPAGAGLEVQVAIAARSSSCGSSSNLLPICLAVSTRGAHRPLREFAQQLMNGD
jgi:hypothetical protein